jgi:hypothetical protein
MPITREEALTALGKVNDPELHKPLTQLNMIKDLNVSAEGASAMHTRSSGAKSASEMAVAAPAGPAPAIRTSKSAKAQLAFTAYQDATTPAGLIGGGPPPFGALPECGTVRTIDPTMAGTCCTPLRPAGTK